MPGDETGVARAAVLDPAPGPPEPEAGSGGGRRAFWTLTDQALSSLTNAALSIVVAGAVGKTDFGAFSLAVITYGFTVGLCRALVGEPFVVRFSAVGMAGRKAGSARAAGAAVVFGVLAGLACLVVALLTGGPTRTAFAALAVSLPGLVVQDTWRHMFFASGRPAAATVNDLVWAVLQFAGLAVLLVTGSGSVFLITLVWGASATLAAVAGVLQTGVLPRPGAAREWMVETRELNVQLGLGYVVNQGALQVGYYSVGGIVGVAGVGALRAAQVLLGPIGLLFAGVNSFILPVLSRRVAAGRRLLPVALPSSAGLAVVTTVWLAALLVVPDSLGTRILGESWTGAREVMLPSGLVLVGLALVLGASNSLVAMSRADLMLAITAVQAPLILVLGVLGAWRWGAVGAAWGFAVAQLVGLVVAWTYFLRVDGRTPPDSGPAQRPEPRVPGMSLTHPDQQQDQQQDQQPPAVVRPPAPPASFVPDRPAGPAEPARRRWVRPVAVLAAVVLVLGSGEAVYLLVSGDDPTPVAIKGPDRTRAGVPSAALGVFRGTDPAEVEAFQTWLGSKVDFIVDFPTRDTWDQIANPAYMLDAWRDTPYRKVYSIAMLPAQDGSASIEQGATGAYDQYYVQLAQHLVEAGQSDAVLRLGWEFNLESSRWSTGDASAWKAYWRHIVTAMRSVDGQAFEFDWNVNNGKNAYDAVDYYPGDDVVDYVGVDAYDTSWAFRSYPYPEGCDDACRLERQQRAWVNSIYGGARGLRFWSTFARHHGKPMSLPEWGLWQRPDGRGGGADPYYLKQMAAFVEDPLNDVAYQAYFEFDGDDGAHRLMTTFGGTGQEFRTLFAG